MSFAFNPPNRYTVSGGGAQVKGRGAATHPQDGLSISPESAVSHRGDLLAAFVLMLLGVGFLMAACLFIFTLVSATLA